MSDNKVPPETSANTGNNTGKAASSEAARVQLMDVSRTFQQPLNAHYSLSARGTPFVTVTSKPELKVQVDWAVGSRDVWKGDLGDVQAQTGIWRYRLYENPVAKHYTYTLDFSTTSGYPFKFADASGDQFVAAATTVGDNSISFHSENATIVFIS